MKKTLLLALTLLLTLSLLTACTATTDSEQATTTAAQAETTDDKLQMIKDKGTLVIGTSADYPPYEFHKEINGADTIVGFDIDIAQSIADDIGVEMEIVDMKFEGLLPALTAGKIDMIAAGMTVTEERKQSVDFSEVYYIATQSLLVHADKVNNYTTTDDFKGKVIGAQKATIQEDLAIDVFTESEIKSIDKIPNLILELKSGKIDAIVIAKVVGTQYDVNNDDIVVSDIALGNEEGAAIAVQKGSETLLTSINSTLKRMIEAGEVDQLVLDAIELSEEN